MEKRRLIDRLGSWAEKQLGQWDELVREVRRETKLGQEAGRGLFSSAGHGTARHTHERTAAPQQQQVQLGQALASVEMVAAAAVRLICERTYPLMGSWLRLGCGVDFDPKQSFRPP